MLPRYLSIEKFRVSILLRAVKLDSRSKGTYTLTERSNTAAGAWSADRRTGSGISQVTR
jgi:hypothetical protein